MTLTNIELTRMVEVITTSFLPYVTAILLIFFFSDP